MFLPLVTPENLNQHYWPQPMLDNLFNFRFLSFFYCFCVKGDEKYYLSANGGPKVSQTLFVCDVIIHNQPFIYCLYIASTCINFTRVVACFITLQSILWLAFGKNFAENIIHTKKAAKLSCTYLNWSYL